MSRPSGTHGERALKLLEVAPGVTEDEVREKTGTQAQCPTTAAGLRPARDWIARRTGGEPGDVLVAARAIDPTGSAVCGDVPEVAGMGRRGAHPRRGGRKQTDVLDAVLAAGSTLAVHDGRWRRRRGDSLGIATVRAEAVRLGQADPLS